MDTSCIVGLKTVRICLRRLRLEGTGRIDLSEKMRQLSTQIEKPLPKCEIPRSEEELPASGRAKVSGGSTTSVGTEVSVGSEGPATVRGGLSVGSGGLVKSVGVGNLVGPRRLGLGTSMGPAESWVSGGSGGSAGFGVPEGSGGGVKLLMAVGFAVGTGVATYYYWNENTRDPFTWMSDQLPLGKKRPETQPFVPETEGSKFKNSANKVRTATATEKTEGEGETSVLRSAQNTMQEPVVKATVATSTAITKIEESQREPAVTVKESVNQQITPSLSKKEIRAMYEKDLLKALTRQAHVFQETFEQSRNVLKSEFERKLKIGHEIGEAERMVEIRAKYGQATAALTALEKALKGRREQEILSERSRKLWTYCNLLYHQINHNPDGNSAPLQPISTTKASLLKELSGDSFVVHLLNSLPDEMADTENLRGRFFNVVDANCRKVALFKNGEHFTFWKYLLGSFQESVVAKCEGKCNLESGGSPFEILDRTSFHLKRGELLEAVYILNKMEGLPREVCRDWLIDARAILEANQTLLALMTHAMANNNFK